MTVREFFKIYKEPDEIIVSARKTNHLDRVYFYNVRYLADILDFKTRIIRVERYWGYNNTSKLLLIIPEKEFQTVLEKKRGYRTMEVYK